MRSSLAVRSFSVNDLKEMEPHTELPPNAVIHFGKPNVFGWTALHDNEIVGVAGIVKLWRGVGEAWFMLSKKGAKMPYRVANCADQMFDEVMVGQNLHRMQASVSTLDPKAVRFARWIGFEPEGIMKKYGEKGEDFFRMARVR
jgi:RimJ/RimL family protein N-acetyltransferase